MTDANLDSPTARALLGSLCRGASSIIPALALSAAVIVVWEAVIRLFHVPTFVLPAPTAIIASLAANRGALIVASQATTLEVLFGFVLSAVGGVLVGLAIVRFQRSFPAASP